MKNKFISCKFTTIFWLVVFATWFYLCVALVYEISSSANGFQEILLKVAGPLRNNLIYSIFFSFISWLYILNAVSIKKQVAENFFKGMMWVGACGAIIPFTLLSFINNSKKGYPSLTILVLTLVFFVLVIFFFLRAYDAWRKEDVAD